MSSTAAPRPWADSPCVATIAPRRRRCITPVAIATVRAANAGQPEAWCAKQRAAVLPVAYHHLVLTLPHVLNPWIEVHDRELYALLFATVWATLSVFGLDPKRLGGQLGMTAVLHTWGQTLTRHVHLHCLVPGGVLTEQGHWSPATSTYLFPVRALSRHLRGGFVSRLRQAIAAGRFERLKDSAEIDAALDALMGPSGWSTPSPVWVVPRPWSITSVVTAGASP